MSLLLNEINGYYGFSGHYVIYFSHNRYILAMKIQSAQLAFFRKKYAAHGASL